MYMNKEDLKAMLDINNELKITYDTGRSKCNKYVYFTGSTWSELIDTVKRDYVWPHGDIPDDAHLVFNLYWFDHDDDEYESKVIINHDDGVKIFMKRTSGLKIRRLHVQPYLKFEELDEN